MRRIDILHFMGEIGDMVGLVPDHVLLFTALSPDRVTDTELDRLRVV